MSFEKIVKLACKPKAAPPKAKYLDPIIAATYQDDGAVSDVCRALATRLREPNATVVYKGLIVLHIMIRTGNTENVLGHLAESDPLRLQNIANGHWDGYSAPENLGSYANFLQSRIKAFKDLKHDAVRVQSESNRDHRLSLMEGDREWESNGNTGNGGVSRSKTIVGRKLRVMSVEKGLLRETRIVQGVVDALVETKFYEDNLEEELNVLALRMLVKDMLVLFQAVNEGVINILEHYFEMSHTDAQAALSLYRHFCKQTGRVVEYLSVAKKLQNLLNVSIPNLKHAPVSLVTSLEQYLNDPNFEENRLEYRVNKAAADGKPVERQKTRPPSPPPAPTKEPEASTSTSKETKPRSTSTSDFFSSIEQEQNTMFNPNTNSPTANYFQQQSSINPFTQRQSMLFPQQTGAIAFQAQTTGFPGPSPFPQPQGTLVNPPGAFIIPQPPPQQGVFLSPQPRAQLQINGMLQPQPTAFLQPQPTGSNPFRQSMLLPQATGFSTSPLPMSNYNPFPRPGSALASVSGPIGSSTLHTLQEMPTGAGAPNATAGFSIENSNSFSPFSLQSQTATSAIGTSIRRPASTPIKSSNTAMSGVVSHQTGSGKNSRNPFGNPAPPPVPPLPKAPTLQELASGAASAATPVASSETPLLTPPGGGGAFLQTQRTGNGLIGSVASSFVSSPGTSQGSEPLALTSNSPFASLSKQNQSGLAVSSQPTSSSVSSSAFGGSSAFSSGFGTISGTSTSSTQLSVSPLQSQPTGFAGSTVRPFKPSSNFGANLVDKLPTIQSEPTTPAITGAPTGPLLETSSNNRPPALELPSFASFSLSPSPGGTGAFNAGASQNQGLNLTSPPSLLGTSFTLGSNNNTGLGGGLSAFGGGGLRPQPTGGGAANPFRASMMFGGSGVPGGATNTSTTVTGGAFGGLNPAFSGLGSPSGVGGGNTALNAGFGPPATQSRASAFGGGSLRGTNNTYQQSLI